MSLEGWLLILFAALAWFWWDSLQKREIALAAARQACERAGVQFLDASVALRKLRLRRDAEQRARFYREYVFEYSTEGDDRQPGWVWLLGARVVNVTMVEQNGVPMRS
ncbi:MAG: DUF3301 domain-containing protein [Pseudomonadota bacterium]|nr:DUF3301 domain-containing protein [Pseudomonadota bacterium]MDP1903906.1 DUF3301 domain-containing protein [Pseudomonadota bacterium]MDP2351145.1 DUF3301 domain-containing protein [Pseudomonadota bacterium]